MSTNKTPNYNLHSWVPQDDFHVSEINENFTQLDASLKAEADALAVAIQAEAQSAAAARSALSAAIQAEATTRTQQLAGKADNATVTTLSQQVAGKADKSTVTSLTTQVNAKADKTTVNTLSQQVAKKLEVVIGTYTSSESGSVYVNLGFRPKAVFAVRSDSVLNFSSSEYYLAFTRDGMTDSGILIDATGFTARFKEKSRMNYGTSTYNYLAIK